MPLSVGDWLGPYEILALIGKGGMGEVYRAHDTKLKRDVALKVLPAAFARDPDRMARFQQEAEVLASLNHPNIAAIYGVEQSDGIPCAGHGTGRGRFAQGAIAF
jgi:eukaryotic-like serine/threonine-protein kinase